MVAQKREGYCWRTYFHDTAAIAALILSCLYLQQRHLRGVFGTGSSNSIRALGI